MGPNPQETVYLVTFTGEILNGKLYILCSDEIRHAGKAGLWIHGQDAWTPDTWTLQDWTLGLWTLDSEPLDVGHLYSGPRKCFQFLVTSISFFLLFNFNVEFLSISNAITTLLNVLQMIIIT